MSDDQHWAGQVNDELEHNAGFGVDDVLAVTQRNQSIRKQQEILEQQKKIAKALDAQQREQKRIESLPKCPRCVSPVETAASVCSHCKAEVVIIGPLTKNYTDQRRSASGHLIFERSEMTARVEKLKTKLKLFHDDFQTSLDTAMTCLAKAAVPFSFLHLRCRIPSHPQKKDTSSSEMNTGCLAWISGLLGFGLLAVVCINLDAAGYSNENFPGGNFGVLSMAILFVAGPPLVVKLFVNQGHKDRAEAEKEYLKEKTEYDEALRKVEEYLASYGFGTLSNLKSELFKAENSYFEIAGAVVSFNSDLRTVSNSVQTLGVESPTVLPSSLRAAFIRGDRPFRPRHDTGKTAIDKILTECREFVTVPPLPLKEKRIATGNDFTKVVKQNEATNEKAVSTNQGVEVTDAEENILELEPISEFWVRRGKAMRGPVSMKVIKEALQQGKLDATDLIASHKNGPWVTLSEGVKQYGFN